MRIVVLVMSLCGISLTSGELNPNVLLIIVDDLRPTIHAYGDSVVKTPNIDRLIGKSVQFWNMHAQQALCGPSRTSFLTSRRPDTIKIHSQGGPYWRRSGRNYTSLPQYFKESGYHTVSLGKVFHPGPISGKTDDYPYSWSEVPNHSLTEKYRNAKVCPGNDTRLHANLLCPVDVREQPYGTLPDIETTNTTSSYLNKLSSANRPFFLAVGLHKPHIPLKYPRGYDDLYQLDKIPLASDRHRPTKLPPVAWNPFMDVKLRDDVSQLNITFPYGEVPDNFQKRIIRSYYSSISYVDDLIGQIMTQLDTLTLYNSTIIVLMSDHGWSLGEHGEWSKYSNYDVSTRVPFSVYLPPAVLGRLKLKQEKKHVYSMTELIDLFPTLAELAGLGSLPRCLDETTITCTDGRSLVSELYNFNTYPISVNVSCSQYPRPSLEPQANSDQPHRKDIRFMGYSIKSTFYRYVRWVSFNATSKIPNINDVYAEELYNATLDPGEDNNLVPGLPSVVKKHFHLMLKHCYRLTDMIGLK